MPFIISRGFALRMPVTQTKGLVDGELVVISKKKKHASVSAADLNSSFSALAVDPPLPCKMCDKLIEAGKSIRCDKCVCWLHMECSNLSKTDFAFLDKPSLPSSIKWSCPRCESNTDKPDENPDKFDRLANLLLSVTKQNTEILTQMKNDRKLEEVKERKIEKSIKIGVSEVLEDRRHKEDRRNNLIFFNMQEGTDNDEGKKSDIENVKKVISFVCPDINTDTLSTQNMFRLGTRKDNTPNGPSRPRPIKITFGDPKPRDFLLKNARKLKDSLHKHVGISADKTKKEREEELETRKEFTVRKLQGEDIVLYRNVIYNRSEAPWLKRGPLEDSVGNRPAGASENGDHVV